MRDHDWIDTVVVIGLLFVMLAIISIMVTLAVHSQEPPTGQDKYDSDAVANEKLFPLPPKDFHASQFKFVVEERTVVVLDAKSNKIRETSDYLVTLYAAHRMDDKKWEWVVPVSFQEQEEAVALGMKWLKRAKEAARAEVKKK
jgi:hypothetical protein